MTRALVALLLATCAACGTRTTELVDDAGGLPGLVSLNVSPARTSLELTDLAARPDLTLTATGTFSGGETRDVTAEVDWTTEPALAGSFVEPGHWVASGRAGGPITAVARSGGIAAGARIELTVRLSLPDPEYPPPPGATDAFAGETPVVIGDPVHGPRIVYPADQVMLPLALRPIVFQYDTGDRADVFRLRFRATFLQLDVFVANDRWLPADPLWELLTRTAAGDAVTFTVDGVASAAPTTIWSSPPIDVDVAAAEVPGAIYYWTSATSGVVRGTLAQPAPTRVQPQPPDTSCVGCHALSRDGRRMAAGYGGERLEEITVPERTTIIAPAMPAGWSTFSPDGHRLLVAQQGHLTLLDADSGAPVGRPGGVVDAGGPATHPDWSPRGDAVVVARCPMAGDNRNVEHCSLVRLPFAADAFGPPVVLVAAGGGDDNDYLPRYSPDGAWIAYVHANGKSKTAASAELRLVAAAGGTPLVLARANQRVGPDDGVTGLANTMPAWAPERAGGLDWLAFASTRDYGKLRVGAKPSQLWIVAVDPARADPGFAAFWLPLQDGAERNHRPYWAALPDDEVGRDAPSPAP